MQTVTPVSKWVSLICRSTIRKLTIPTDIIKGPSASFKCVLLHRSESPHICPDALTQHHCLPDCTMSLPWHAPQLRACAKRGCYAFFNPPLSTEHWLSSESGWETLDWLLISQHFSSNPRQGNLKKEWGLQWINQWSACTNVHLQPTSLKPLFFIHACIIKTHTPVMAHGNSPKRL